MKKLVRRKTKKNDNLWRRRGGERKRFQVKKDKNTNMKIPSDSVDLFPNGIIHPQCFKSNTKMNSLSFKALSVWYFLC